MRSHLVHQLDLKYMRREEIGAENSRRAAPNRYRINRGSIHSHLHGWQIFGYRQKTAIIAKSVSTNIRKSTNRLFAPLEFEEDKKFKCSCPHPDQFDISLFHISFARKVRSEVLALEKQDSVCMYKYIYMTSEIQ